MKKLFAILLIFLFLALPVLAEEQINLSTPGDDFLTPYALPDGRIILSGNAGENGNNQNKKARLVCLNTDGTVAWDYSHPAEGICNFSNVHLLPDGQLGVVFTNSQDQTTVEAAIYKFSLDGEVLTGPISIFTENMFMQSSTDACITYLVSSPDGQNSCYHFFDWDGRFLFQLPAESIMGGGFQTLSADDGVLLIGNETGFPALGKLMKLDLTGNVVWSQTLEPSLPNANHAKLSQVFPLKDGGFAVTLYEKVYSSDSSRPSATEGYLLRFDKDGTMLWKTAIQHGGIRDVMMTDCMEYSNYLVAAADPTFASEKVWKYDWFDLNSGALLKSTEQAIPDGITTFGGDFVVLDNGLWICRYFRQNIENDVKDSLNSGDMIMMKVPEE